MAGGNVAIALLANALATGAGLLALILTFGPISGCHLNPVVTIAVAAQGALAWKRVPGYVVAQCLGAILGVFLAHLMFDESIFQISTHARHGTGQLASEAVATFGLLGVIWGCSRRNPTFTPFGGCRVHYCCLLVHGIDLIRQSRRNDCAFVDRHLLGHSPC